MSQVEVVMYSTNWCGYCQRARNLFERKGIAVRDIKLDDEPDQRPVMLERTGGLRTVPNRRPSPAARGVPSRTMRIVMVFSFANPCGPRCR